VGGELARILLQHPVAELKYVTAQSHAGERLDHVHKNLRGITDLMLMPHPLAEASPRALQDLDVLFLALPHGTSMQLLPGLPEQLQIIDLASDYRVKNRDLYHKFHQLEHVDSANLAHFIYGLAEVNRTEIAKARLVANPGCFATAVQLALWPVVRTSLSTGTIFVDGKTGSSGSGVSPSASTHHPRRDGAFYAYKPFTHQHTAEILETLQASNPEWAGDVVMQCHSAPMVRGVFVSCYVKLRQAYAPSIIDTAFREAYTGNFFIRLIESSPDVKWVQHSNFADLHWVVQGDNLIVFAAIDNLLKGASGQAVQNMNLMNDLPEQTGLLLLGGNP
jgi:N-acetyl-gamma-glutamyl-phosphate reductase